MMHYEALEITKSATAADIRRAYRRLVLLTHPDRTPDPAAHARYLAINAAYEVLSDPARRGAYDAALQAPAFHPPSAASSAGSPGRTRDARRHTRRPAQAWRAPVAAVRYAAEYARALRVARPLMLGSLLLCASLVLDLWLATERLEKVLRTEADHYQEIYHYTERGSFMLPDELPVGSTLLVRRTPLWRTAVDAQLSYNQEPIAFSTVYRGASNAFWWGLVLTATLALTPRLSNDSRLVAALVAMFCLALTLLLMFS